MKTKFNIGDRVIGGYVRSEQSIWIDKIVSVTVSEDSVSYSVSGHHLSLCEGRCGGSEFNEDCEQIVAFSEDSIQEFIKERNRYLDEKCTKGKEQMKEDIKAARDEFFNNKRRNDFR